MSPRSTPKFPDWPQFDDAERTALMRALEQGQWWRMGGEEVSTFEREFADYHGARYALAVTNGTHALELALQGLGVGPGTEVIVPAFTFISSSQAAQRIGAVAVPVDIDPDTYNIDVAAAGAAITDRTRVIMPVHMAGLMADMDGLGKLAEEAGLDLVQDAAHAQGARWQGKRVGELGTVATFSFQNGKLMTAGEGGAVLFDDEDLYQDAFLRHSCGRPSDDRLYVHKLPGTNMRMNEFAAAVLRAQMTRLDRQIELRNQRWVLLSSLLAKIPGVRPQGHDPRADRNPLYMAMFRVSGWTAPRRNALVDTLRESGIPAAAAFRPVYRTDAFWAASAPQETPEQVAARCPNAEAVGADCVWLHHRVLLADEQVLRDTVEIIRELVVG
jgi:3-amino-5-hydroxybenzoate synthase